MRSSWQTEQVPKGPALYTLSQYCVDGRVQFLGELFRIFVDYDSNKTEGLTAEDLIDPIFVAYGKPTRPVATINPSSPVVYGYNDTDSEIGSVRLRP
jgi:hypothetical protein